MTPLFAPLNLDDESKINALIRNNYCGVDNSILDEYVDVASEYELVDLLDFSRVNFDKTIKTVATLSIRK